MYIREINLYNVQNNYLYYIYMTSRDDSKKPVEHFGSNVPTIMVIIFAIVLPLLVLVLKIYGDFFISKSSIKYLTSSTSPSFDLTFTPNME